MIKDSEYKMPFGKHKGELLEHVPTSYLLWFIDQDWASKWSELYAYVKKNKKRLQEEEYTDNYDDESCDAPVGCDGWGRWARGED